MDKKLIIGGLLAYLGGRNFGDKKVIDIRSKTYVHYSWEKNYNLLFFSYYSYWIDHRYIKQGISWRPIEFIQG